MSKAISSIIGTLLMLIITIGLFGFSYSFISGVFTAKTAEVFSVVDSFGNSVTISNDGTQSITSMRVTLDGSNVDDPSLVAYWSFNDGSGTTAKDSGGNNDGTLMNSTSATCFINGACPEWVEGRHGFALDFSRGDYVNAGNDSSLKITGDLSIEAWVRINSSDITGNPAIVSKWAGSVPNQRAYSIGFNLSDAITFAISKDGTFIGGASIINSTATFAGGPNWYHFVGTYKSVTDGTSKMNLYINGIKATAEVTTAVSPIFGSPVNLTIGASSPGSGQFNGTIDDVRIYNRALTADEILIEYNNPGYLNPGKVYITPGKLLTIYFDPSLSKGSHTVRMCTSSTCNTAVLRIN
ncbi:MAG: hypothetical protein HY361_02000 [Candidatus Aenigmarchaeota archaeon]|nr:hypothetical protein [Candidatus Aenigmarchaeota archaeon]